GRGRVDTARAGTSPDGGRAARLGRASEGTLQVGVPRRRRIARRRSRPSTSSRPVLRRRRTGLRTGTPAPQPLQEMVMALTESVPGPAGPPSDDAAVRDERLHTSLMRSRRAGVAISERWLFTLGGALAIGGIALVIVGWAGTSRTVLVAGQIPYLVSGGLLGLGFVFLGGFLYFGYWLAVLVRESGERGERDRADFERL